MRSAQRYREQDMKQKLMLIVNPVAGKAHFKIGFGDVMRIFSEGGYRTTVYFTEAQGDAIRFAAEFAPQYDLVACIGGDGTLSEVMSGLMAVPKEQRPRLGYIPMGSTNDVASTLGLPKVAVEAAHRIIHGDVTPFDVGSFGAGSYFTYVAAFGAFTDVSYETPQNEKAALGHLAYVLQGLAQLPRQLKPTHARITTAEGDCVEGDFLYGGASNSTSVAGLIKLKKDLVSLSDGVFEAMLIRNPRNIAEFSRIVTSVLGQNFNNEYVQLIQSRELKFEFNEPVAWTRDGEAGGVVREVVLRNNHAAVNIIA